MLLLLHLPQSGCRIGWFREATEVVFKETVESALSQFLDSTTGGDPTSDGLDPEIAPGIPDFDRSLPFPAAPSGGGDTVPPIGGSTAPPIGGLPHPIPGAPPLL